MAHSSPVEREVDHQFTRGRAPERSGRAAQDDGPEDRHFDAVGHAGERSAAHSVGAEGFEPSLGTV